MKEFFIIYLICIGLCIVFCIMRAILGPRFTDRLVCANVITTKVMAAILILGILFDEEFIYDIALVYAMIGFVAVTVLGKMFAGKGRFRKVRK